jgi:multidrug resistance protein MdtO
VFLLPSLTSAQALLVTVFAGALLSAWVVAGPPRISYAGFQIAFAFFLCVIQGASPAFDLTIARDRIIGILIGNLVMYLVFTRVWPVSVARRVDSALTGLLERLRTAIRTPGSQARHAIAAETVAALGAIERDLDLAEYEPASVRPAGTWLQARRHSVAEIGELQASLLLNSVHEAPEEGAARTVERLRGEFGTTDAT